MIRAMIETHTGLCSRRAQWTEQHWLKSDEKHLEDLKDSF